MWNVRPDRDKTRGGFQDRDVGRSNFRDDFGPEYGIDFARFADSPDTAKDQMLLETIREEVSAQFTPEAIIVKNGFVILKGLVANEETKDNITREIQKIPGVVYVINTLSFSNLS